jgi:hypothetical protein
MAIANHLDEWVAMPVTEEETNNFKRRFYSIRRFPGVIGCTHIPIINPGGELAEVYRNRKGWFSLNVQVCLYFYIMHHFNYIITDMPKHKQKELRIPLKNLMKCFIQ